jgi:hypothetical protein
VDVLLKLFPLYVALLLLIQLVPVRINLYFLRENKDDFLNVRINTFYSIIRFNLEIPMIRQKTPLDVTVEAELQAGQDELIREEETEFSVLDIPWEKIREYLSYLHRNRRRLWFLLKFLTRAMLVEKLDLRVRAGTDDAAVTGLLGGVYWTAAGSLTAMAQQWFRLKEKPVFAFAPDFSAGNRFAARFNGVVSFRIGHFTIAGIILLLTKLRGGNV